jgi:dipeptidyl aminopeptidase/acylaminoacyl peptidase
MRINNKDRFKIISSLLLATIIFCIPFVFAADWVKPDIATFMKIGSTSAPSVVTGSNEVYFLSSTSGTAQLYRLTDKGWPYQLTSFQDGIEWYFVSDKGDKAIVGFSAGGTERAQLYLVNTENGLWRALTANPDVLYGSVVWKGDGSGFYYRCNIESKKDFKIYYYDLKTDNSTKIYDGVDANFITSVSPDGRYLVILKVYSNTNSDIYLLDTATGKSELLTPHKGDVIYDKPTIMPDNQTIYLLSNGNKDGVIKRARLEIASKSIEYLDKESNRTIDNIYFSPNRDWMVWLINDAGYSTLQTWKIGTDETHICPISSAYVEEAAITDDGYVVFAGTTPIRTQDIWAWDRFESRARQLTFSSYAGVDPSVFLEPKLIKYKSFDGLEIPAFLYLPPDYDGKPIPFIIHAHGGPSNQFRPYFQRNFQYLLQNGYGILAPNIRGSSGYGKEYMALDDGKKRLNSIKDIKAACDYLIDNKYSQIGMLGIKGGSYGGYVSLAAITEYPDLFSAAVEDAGIANFVTFLRNTADYRRKNREAEYGSLEDTAFLASISPINKASVIKTPLLVIHGVNDSRVPIGEARQIIKAIQDKGGVVDSLIISDEGHIGSSRDNTVRTYSKIMEFLDKYLKK